MTGLELVSTRSFSSCSLRSSAVCKYRVAGAVVAR